MKNNKLETITNLFENSEIRSVWDSEKEDYYFSVVDVISALTNANIPRNYWSDLKRRLKQEGSELHENIVQLKMKAQDGKYRETDVLDTKGIFRLIESVPSKKAEPFKMWLAHLGKERIDEVFDPEVAANRVVNYYRSKGYTDDWIKKRLIGIVDRFKLTDVWKDGGIENPIEYALLTNEIYMTWSGMKASEYKDYKGIRKITPLECFYAQGFPHKFKLPNDMSDSKLYKQAGNSVAVPVVSRIANNIITALEYNE